MTARERLRAARQAAQAGRHEEALRELIWFHHHALEEEPALRGVRLSYALYDWAGLGKVYPPAWDALDAQRAQNAQTLLDGGGGKLVFLDLISIHDAMDMADATYTLYRTLAERQPSLARELAGLALPALIAAKDYALADRMREAPEDEIRWRAELLAWELVHFKRMPHAIAPTRASAIKRYTDMVQSHLEITAGVGDPARVLRLKALATGLLHSPSLRAAVRTALDRRAAQPRRSQRARHRPGQAWRPAG